MLGWECVLFFRIISGELTASSEDDIMGFNMLIFFTRQSDISEIGVTSHIFERTMNIMSRQNFSDMFVTTTVLSGLGGATCFSVLATPQQLHSSLLLQQRDSVFTICIFISDSTTVFIAILCIKGTSRVLCHFLDVTGCILVTLLPVQEVVWNSSSQRLAKHCTCKIIVVVLV